MALTLVLHRFISVRAPSDAEASLRVGGQETSMFVWWSAGFALRASELPRVAVPSRAVAPGLLASLHR